MSGVDPTPEIERYRRHLPHWRKDGAIYYVTWHLHRDQAELEPAERDLVLPALTYHDNRVYTLFAAVVMSDHVHMLLQPLAGKMLEKIMHSRKGSTSRKLARRFGRQAPVWQSEYFDRIVRDPHEFDQKLRYIIENPARRWPGTVDYAWLWVRDQ